VSRTSRIFQASKLRHEDNRKDVSAKDVVAAFNTWAFKREKPSDLDLLNAFVDTAIEAEDKLSFVLYWGKGPRSYACAPELDCLSFLSRLADRVKQAYPLGAIFDLVFTDTHARLNGHGELEMAKYFEDVARHADSDLFRFHRLSDCIINCGQEVNNPETPTTELLDELEKSASKWFRGEGTPRQAAATYFAMNMRERRAIEASFPRSIFTTFNGSTFRCLFPTSLPIFYMYSIKKGVAIKPWFLPDPANTGDLDTIAEKYHTVAA
jgi:hypothetical protein